MTGILDQKFGDGTAARTRPGWDERSGVRQEVLLDVVAVGLEQHAGAAELTNLLLRPLDHAVALAALGMHHLAGGSHLEALFSARFGLQLGHLALLWPQQDAPREALLAAEMLVRALKVLRFSEKRMKPRTGHRHGSPKSAGR